MRIWRSQKFLFQRLPLLISMFFVRLCGARRPIAETAVSVWEIFCKRCFAGLGGEYGMDFAEICAGVIAGGLRGLRSFFVLRDIFVLEFFSPVWKRSNHGERRADLVGAH